MTYLNYTDFTTHKNTLDTIFNFPKAGVLKGVVRTDGEGQTTDWIVATANAVGGLEHINRDSLPSYQDYLDKSNVTEYLSEEDFNTVITSIINSAESELTKEQMVSNGFIVEPEL